MIMNGIYLTEQGKQEIEAKIAELEDIKSNCKTDYEWNESVVEQNVYKKILSSATILSVYESLGHAMQNKDLDNSNGVIIQPKK